MVGPPKLMGWEGREKEEESEKSTVCQVCRVYMQSLRKAGQELKMMSAIRCMYRNTSSDK